MALLPEIFSGNRRILFSRLVVNGVLQSVAIVVSMFLIRHAFDDLLNPEFDDPEIHLGYFSDVWEIAWFSLGLLASTGCAGLLRYIERIDAEKLGQAYVHAVRLTVFDRMSRFAPRALSGRTTGSSMLRFVSDLSAIRRWVSLGLARIVVSTVVTLLSISVLAWFDLYLAFAAVTILCLGLGWNLRMGPGMHRVIAEARRRRGHLAGNINEKIRSYIVIQAFNQRRRERRRFKRQSLALADAMVERAGASAKMRVVNEGATAASMAAILSLGALEVFRGMTTSGNVVAAMTVVGFLSNAFRDLGRVHEYLQAFRVSRNKIIEFMRTRRLRGRSSKLPSLKLSAGKIELQKIGLKGVIEGFSGVVPGGSRLAIIGDNGSGKSTLLQIIARLIDPDEGKVLIDDQDIGKCNTSSVREVIGIVSPDLPLLKGSLGYNLRYRKPDATREEINRVYRLCDLDGLVGQLPGCESFRIKEGGSNLSLGQRHKVALARAILGPPSILIVDEIDANLDEQALKVLERVLDNFPGTVLMVSRSEDRLAKADRYWYIRDGKLDAAVESDQGLSRSAPQEQATLSTTEENVNG
jgi:ABC-type multidrug transport system fused ATPase/permease subunit